MHTSSYEFGRIQLVKLSVITFILSMGLFLSANSQVKGASQNLKTQAAKMGTAFISGDYKTFASYTHPVVLKAVGGASKMAEMVEKSINQMKADSMNFTSVNFDEPSAIVKKGIELQATIAQHTEIKLSKGRLLNTSTLIGISIDNGVNWKFIDTSNNDVAALRKAFPNLSPSLVIPPPQKPVKYND